MKNKIKNFIAQPNFWPRLIFALVVCVLMLASFQFGKMVGYRQSGFANRLGDNYRRAFDGQDRRPGKFGLPPLEMGLPSGHGAIGKVIKIGGGSLVLSAPDNIEKTIIFSQDTLVKKFRETVNISDLQTGDMVVVLGDPNDSGEIVAKLIRLMPAPNSI